MELWRVLGVLALFLGLGIDSIDDYALYPCFFFVDMHMRFCYILYFGFNLFDNRAERWSYLCCGRVRIFLFGSRHAVPGDE